MKALEQNISMQERIFEAHPEFTGKKFCLLVLDMLQQTYLIKAAEHFSSQVIKCVDLVTLLCPF